MQIRPITAEELEDLPKRAASTGNSFLIVTPFETHDLHELDGLVIEEDGRLLGAVTLVVQGRRCEIVTIDAFEEDRGVGTALVNAVRGMARMRGCDRVELFTTNDNLRARGFYERLGFRVLTIYPDAMDLVRKVKPDVPHRGLGGMPLRDMIRYELRLT